MITIILIPYFDHFIKAMLKEIGWILVIILLFIAILYGLQRSFIYLPAKITPQRGDFQANDMSKIKLQTADDLSLLAWYKAAEDNLPTVIYLHGNAGHIGYRMPIARKLMDAGFGVLLVEYRGYGGNAGRPSEKGFYMDGEAAIQFLLQRGLTPQEMVLYGESIGSGVATYLAAKLPVCAVILQSPMTSLKGLARFHYPWFPFSPWDKYDSLKRIDKINASLLILHGKQDRVVPFEEGKTLFEKAVEPKLMISFTDRGHNNLWDNTFYQKILDFIRAYCA
ncbi:Bem46 protein [Legionella israelensis]|uniref:Alpha/beta superfamily hydrolase n=2 Tax=Legionella israelensis TaxID=454 RepID=A0A0W0W8S4_9GAMM|nr:alpha/beta superfamily hydrolase [Legionella israelensis]SCX87786.1 hypothetical protein SAMN02746069_00517 [Legionella israelensis DSM 19235]STX60327.1 Bem46 protein [Legionella israelensis]